MSNNTTVKWKRFTRASYAVFNSLHKEVAVGVLTVAMLQSAGLKAKTPSLRMALGIGVTADAEALSPFGDAEGTLLDSLGIALGDVTVVGTRVPLLESQAPRMITVLSAADVTAAAVHSINDLLEYAVGVDVRQRGEMGVQTDVSVRGGTFDQITLLLNGVNISSPHTGHLSADFPVSMDDIERIEVVEGPAARVFGTSAFTGVVNIVTKTASTKALDGQLHLRGGAYGYGGGDARMTHSNRTGTLRGELSGGYSRSDGATPNSDFSNTHFFYHATAAAGNATVNGQVGYSYKPYGANTFYGAASTDQWECNERIMAAVNADLRFRTSWGGHGAVTPQLYYNRWNDHYQWHRGVSPAGENRHHVDVMGAGLNSWLESALGKTSLGIEMRRDAINSTNLGTHHRTNTSAFLEHNILLRQWTLSLGVLANNNTGLDHRWRFYPGIDISYRPTEQLRLYASWDMALRMPTYTDLYYSGTGIEGNSNLMPEKTNDISLGARYRTQGLDLQGQTFYSHKSDMIDWIIAVGDSIYRSGNFKLDNVGVELQAALLAQELWGESFPLHRLSVSYAYLSEDISYDRAILKSKYAQEYLRHKVVVKADGTLYRLRSHDTMLGNRQDHGRLVLSLSWRWQDRVGEGNSPYALLDGRLSWEARHWSLYADCTNILDKEYYDYSIVRQPGRWLKAGLILRL